MGPKTDRLKQLAAAAGRNYVGTRGNTAAELLFLGEAPGANEDAEGKPFVGASGKLLDELCLEAGLGPQDYWLTNPYKLRPPDNDIDRRKELGIPEDAYLDQFYEELYYYKPKIIVACGATPLGLLCPETISKRDGLVKISQWRGSLLSSHKLNWPHYIIPMFHPAYVLREWQERIIDAFCVLRAKEELDYFKKNGKLNPLPERELITNPSFLLLREYLTETQHKAKQISVDIEMIRGTLPYTIAVAPSSKSAISFSFWEYDLHDLKNLWLMLDTLLRTKRQIGQNYLGFDCCWLQFLGFHPATHLVDDTMVRHHVLWPELEHKLQFLGFQYTREPYWKDEGKLWKRSEGLDKLMRYNALDAAATFEVYDEQEKEFDDRPHLRGFYSQYEMRLGSAFHLVEKRGIYTDPKRLGDLKDYVQREIERSCEDAEKYAGKPVFPSKDSIDKLIKAGKLDKAAQILNLASPKQLLEEFKRLKLKVPIKRGSGGKPSTGEEQLNKMYAETGNPLLKEILRVRELNKILGTYINCKLAEDTLYTSYIVTGTVTGRRASRTNVFGYGTNLQNQPKHSDLGKRFRGCLVARSGRIFVECDQKGAEDWIVQGIIADCGGSREGLDELLKGINRHKKLASFLFAQPLAAITKDSPYYFMGKKTRHAGNYDMQAQTMAGSFVKEGFHVPVPHCQWLLERFHAFEPGIKEVFHRYIQHELQTKRTLRTLLGRERIFTGLRDYSDNSSIYREAYSYIPQGTVGDNTGMAILYCEDELQRVCLGMGLDYTRTTEVLAKAPFYTLMDTHDAVTLETWDDADSVVKAVRLLERSFDRVLRFPLTGLEITIPIEVSIGYDLKEMKECPDISETGLIATYNTLHRVPKVLSTTTSGAALLS